MKEEHTSLKPLEGIRALEWGAFHAGPGALAILGDLGAEVIKIEQPKVGDPLRRLSRFGKVWVSKNGLSLFYEGANRHKKSITLDLSKEEGKQIVYRLVSKCDIFLTNLRPKTVENMRMTYPVLRQINPKLIYASVSAYGSKGPDSQQGCFDFQGQGRSGMMYCMGEPDMPPLLVQFGLIDQVTAIITSHALLTALFARERTGIGQELQTSILSSAMFLQYFNVLNALTMNQEVPRHERRSTDPMRNYYQCRDGKWICLTLSYHPWNWREFCHAIEHMELETNPKFDTREKRMGNCEELIDFLDKVIATKTQKEWHRILVEHDVFCTPVNTPLGLKDDPQVLANAYIVDFDHPVFGKGMVPGYPIHFSETAADTRGLAPQLGEHTEEILREIGGYSDSEIARFRQTEVI